MACPDGKRDIPPPQQMTIPWSTISTCTFGPRGGHLFGSSGCESRDPGKNCPARFARRIASVPIVLLPLDPECLEIPLARLARRIASFPIVFAAFGSQIRQNSPWGALRAGLLHSLCFLMLLDINHPRISSARFVRRIASFPNGFYWF